MCVYTNTCVCVLINVVLLHPRSPLHPSIRLPRDLSSSTRWSDSPRAPILVAHLRQLHALRRAMQLHATSASAETRVRRRPVFGGGRPLDVFRGPVAAFASVLGLPTPPLGCSFNSENFGEAS